MMLRLCVMREKNVLFVHEGYVDPMIRSLLGSHRIGMVFGIEVRVLFILYVFMALVVVDAARYGVAEMAMWMLVGVGLFISVFLHEMGHSLSALKEGVPVHAIYLHPLGGMARLAGTLPGPYAEIQVALAGPCVNLLILALLHGISYLATPVLHSMDAGFLLHLIRHLAELNLAQALFNLLPVFPLDGGRVLAAFLVLRHGAEEGIRRAGRYALYGIIGLTGIGIWMMVTRDSSTGLSLVLIAVLLYLMGRQEAQARQFVAAYAHSRPPAQERPNWYPRDHEMYGDPIIHKRGWLQRWLDARALKKKERVKAQTLRDNARVDEILRKVNNEGIGGLSAEERQFLEDTSRRNR